MKHYDYSIIYKSPYDNKYQMVHMDSYIPFKEFRDNIPVYYPKFGFASTDASLSSCPYFIPTYHLQVKQDVIQKLQHNSSMHINISKYKSKEISLYLDRYNRFIRKSIDEIERTTRNLPMFDRIKFIVIQNRDGSDRYLCRMRIFMTDMICVEKYVRI